MFNTFNGFENQFIKWHITFFKQNRVICLRVIIIGNHTEDIRYLKNDYSVRGIKVLLKLEKWQNVTSKLKNEFTSGLLCRITN